MQYMLLIYMNEAEYDRRGASKNSELLAEYMKLNTDLQARGQLKHGERLEPTTTATSVRVQDGKVLKTDGPFAETREQLGGFYIIDAKDHDEAVAIAARVPGAKFGCVEVRPIMDKTKYAR